LGQCYALAIQLWLVRAGRLPATCGSNWPCHKLRRSRRWIHVSAPARCAELMNSTRVRLSGEGCMKVSLRCSPLNRRSTWEAPRRSAEADRRGIGLWHVRPGSGRMALQLILRTDLTPSLNAPQPSTSLADLLKAADGRSIFGSGHHRNVASSEEVAREFRAEAATHSN
jgi:hypothetical protein